MAKPNRGQGRYTSRSNAVARQAAQMLLLRPTLWRLLRVRVHGEERLENVEAPYLMYGNHSSHFDAPLIFGSLPRRLSQYLSAGAAADYFFDKWWKAAPTALFLNAFPIERRRPRQRDKSESGPKANRRGLAGNLLAEGVPILVFPRRAGQGPAPSARSTPAPPRSVSRGACQRYPWQSSVRSRLGRRERASHGAARKCMWFSADRCDPRPVRSHTSSASGCGARSSSCMIRPPEHTAARR